MNREELNKLIEKVEQAGYKVLPTNMLEKYIDTMFEKDDKIDRLTNIIDKIQKIINEYDFSIKEEWYEKPENWELDENCYASSYIDLHKICLILKELKEEGNLE